MFADVRAVTFDCWGTLIYEPDPAPARAARAEALAAFTGITLADATALADRAWAVHHDHWVAVRHFGADGMLDWIAAEIGHDGFTADVLRVWEEASLASTVAMVPGARDAIERIKASGRATALICDTGLTPGRVVRRILDAHGLLDLLDAVAFSNEVGVPKPHPAMFSAALDAIGGAPAVHVGDMRRTDVAGARSAGLGSIRFKGIYDDVSDLAEADTVIDDMGALPGLLGIAD